MMGPNIWAASMLVTIGLIVWLVMWSPAWWPFAFAALIVALVALIAYSLIEGQ